MWPRRKPAPPAPADPAPNRAVEPVQAPREIGQRDISDFGHDGSVPDLEGLSDLERLFWTKTGAVIHKWHHYLPIYERYFERFRGSDVKMLEIGVFEGGSLDIWRDYLGADARIFGIDINPACARFDGQSGQVRIGSQADPDFLASVVDEMGGIDIVLDDGSHRSEHIRESLRVLFPRLSEGGVYMVEDLHAAYWTDYGGGYHAASNVMNDFKTLIDDMHHWWHDEGQKLEHFRDSVGALHFHDSIVVIEKQRQRRPVNSMQGERAK